MARDRNVYVWQAYVTVMSIVSLACIGALIFVVFQSGTNYKTVQGALERETAAKDSERKQTNARQVLERIVGVGTPLSESEFTQLVSTVGSDEKLTAAIKAYTTNMALFGPNATEPSYTKLVSTLMSELRARNMQVEAAAKREIDQKDKYDSTIAQETKAREAERQKAQDLANELEKELAKYTENINLQQQTITKIEAEKQTLIQTKEAKIRSLTATVEKITAEKEELLKRLDKLTRKLNEIRGEDFQYVQGRIIEVADGGNTVYINLGKASGLRPGVTFGILDGDITRVGDNKAKAMMEVVAVLDQHLSRCRVLDDRVRKTILREDSIYSPFWQPGKEVEFALVGTIDLNGDLRDDRETAKALIRQNGGKVTYELLPNGQEIGKLTIDTQWLVIGDEFKTRNVAELDAATAALAKKRRDIEDDAKKLNIGKMNLEKFKSWARGGNAGEVLPLGSNLQSTPSDYLPRPSNDNTGRVSELFQARDGNLSRAARQPANP